MSEQPGSKAQRVEALIRDRSKLKKHNAKVLLRATVKPMLQELQKDLT